MYAMLGHKDRMRRASGTDVTRPMLPSKDVISPTVTKLEYDKASFSPLSPPDSAKDTILSSGADSSGRGSPKFQLGLKTSGTAKSRGVGLRAISDAITGSEKAFLTSPLEAGTSLAKPSPHQGLSRTDSSTPSGSKSFEMEYPESSKGS